MAHGADLNGKSVLEERPLGEREELEGGAGEDGGGLGLPPGPSGQAQVPPQQASTGLLTLQGFRV